MGFIEPDDRGGCAAARRTEVREQHVGQRAVHGLGHELREQRACGPHNGAGNDHRGVVEHEAFEGHGETGERVVQRDDHGHVGAADGQRHGDAEQQCQREDQRDMQRIRAMMQNHDDADRERAQEQQAVDELLAAEAHRLVQHALQLRPGDQTTAERDGADDAADHGQRHDNRAVIDRCARRVGIRRAIQLHRGDGRGRAAAHAVVQRDHLRHVGHRDLLAAPPRDDRSHHDGGDDQLVVGHPRVEERDQRGHEHAGAGPDDAAARRHRRAHALEAEDEQAGREEIADVDQQPRREEAGCIRDVHQ